MSRLRELVHSGRARVVVAVDDPSIAVARLSELVGSVGRFVAGFKIGVPYILGNGLSRVSELIGGSRDVYFLADLKLADIDAVMKLTTRLAYSAGFSGVIAHGFVGYEGGLAGLGRFCRELGIELFVVVSMSHPGSLEVYDTVLDRVLDVVRRVDAAGVIAPATRPEVVRYSRRVLGSRYVIASPGVGAQGAQPGSAICAGADVEIVGRAVTNSLDPVSSVMELAKAQEELLARCRGGA